MNVGFSGVNPTLAFGQKKGDHGVAKIAAQIQQRAKQNGQNISYRDALAQAKAQTLPAGIGHASKKKR